MSTNVRHIIVVVALTCIAGSISHARDLTFEVRVAAQEAIERVYYSHQIGAPGSFEEAIPRRVLEEKVRKYLRQPVALEKLWKTPITAAMLRSEMQRMAQGTGMPERLAEIYSALDDDRFLILGRSIPSLN